MTKERFTHEPDELTHSGKKLTGEITITRSCNICEKYYDEYVTLRVNEEIPIIGTCKECKPN